MSRLAYGVLCCVLFALAGGAALSVLAMFAQPLGRLAGIAQSLTDHPLAWLAIPAAWLLGAGMRHWVQLAPAARAALGAAAIFIACTYANCLVTWGRVASAFGIGFVQAMREAGLGNTLGMARLGVSRLDWAMYLLALAVAAFSAARAQRSPVSRPAP